MSQILARYLLSSFYIQGSGSVLLPRMVSANHGPPGGYSCLMSSTPLLSFTVTSWRTSLISQLLFWICLLTSHIKVLTLKLERWLKGQEHWLLLRRACLWSLAPMRLLTGDCNSSSRVPSAFFWLLWAPCPDKHAHTYNLDKSKSSPTKGEFIRYRIDINSVLPPKSVNCSLKETRSGKKRLKDVGHKKTIPC